MLGKMYLLIFTYSVLIVKKKTYISFIRFTISRKALAVSTSRELNVLFFRN